MLMRVSETGSTAGAVRTSGAGGADISLHRAVAPLEREWRAFEQDAAGHVFQTYGFVSTWLATVGRERNVAPLIVVGRDQDCRLLFILPFGIRKRLGQRHLEWLGAEHADYHGGLFDRSFLAGVAEDRGFADRITRLLSREADICSFARQPTTIDGFANPFAGWRSLRHSDSSHETHLGTGWDAYYRAKRNSSSRRHDKSKLRNLEALGEIGFSVATTAIEIDQAMAMLFREKERSLAALGAGGFFASEGVRRFYRDLAGLPCPHGPCHVATLSIGGEIVAANWGLVRGDRYYYVMHAFDADAPAARYSPGRLLMHRLMQWCIDAGIGVFDFTIGDEDFKEQWCETTLTLSDSVAPLTVRAAPLAIAMRSGKAAKRVIKANPRLRGIAERIRRRLAAGRPAAGESAPATLRPT